MTSRPTSFDRVALALALLASACGPEVREGHPHSALLVTLDTTIPEGLSCYGGPDGLTPHLDALAAEGVLYENARTVTPITAPSHASMFTGLYPLRHSVRMNGSMALPADARTLAELARESGFRTAAFVAAVVLMGEFGLDQGFERYDEPHERVTEDDSSRPGGEIVDRAVAWLDELDEGERFFAWVHFFDVHSPYRPTDAHRARAGGDPYLGELAYVDDQVGRLFDALRARGLYDDTMIVVVADHGEALERNREKTHGTLVFDTTLAVPLIVRHVDGWNAGTRSSDVVSVVDVFPTLVEALGLDAPNDIDGESLFRRAVAPERGVYFETYMGHVIYGWSPATGWATRDGKYVHSSAPQFYAIDADPEEQTNLLSERTDAVEVARAAMLELASKRRLEQIGLGANHDDRLSEQIAKLGYAGAGTQGHALPEPLEDVEAPAPITMREAGYELLRAQSEFDRGRAADALPIVRNVLELNPTNHGAQMLYAQCLMFTRRFSQAIREFERADELRGGASIEPLLNIAACYENLRRPTEAIEAYERALANGGPAPALMRLVELLEAAGRADDAAHYRALLPARGGN